MYSIRRDTVHSLRFGGYLLTQSLKDSTALSDSSIRWGGWRFGGNVLVMLVLILLMLPVVGSAETEVEGEVSGVWTAEDSPYIVVDSTWVPEGEELIIQNGVEVRFNLGKGIDVFGLIQARGTEADSVRFTTNQEGEVWRSIAIRAENDETHFIYCIFEYADIAIGMEDETTLTVENCLFNYVNQVVRRLGHFGEGCEINLASCRMNCGTCLGFTFAVVRITDCEITCSEQMGGVGVSMGYLSIVNSIITGTVSGCDGNVILDNSEFYVNDIEMDWVHIEGYNCRVTDCYFQGKLDVFTAQSLLVLNSEVDGDLTLENWGNGLVSGCVFNDGGRRTMIRGSDYDDSLRIVDCYMEGLILIRVC